MKNESQLTESLIVLFMLGSASCTGPLKESFRLLQQEQIFQAQINVNTKMDLLWVIDNSSSMDVTQDRLRKGFSGFAKKYLQPSWDIRLAVITSDTYLAHPNFESYLNRKIPGTVGWSSPYIATRLDVFVNPPSNLHLVNLETGKFDTGIRYRDLVPGWGPSYSRLLKGIHDGPIAGMCFEILPYFFNGSAQCKIRDDRANGIGVEGCLDEGLSEEGRISHCVNTTQNDTVHSNRPILYTLPTGNSLADIDIESWTEQIIRDFTINVSVGSNGHGSERGIGSVLQLLQDNEISDSSFFRQDSLRGIIFVGDEDDQTLLLEAGDKIPEGFHPFSHYRCDQQTLIQSNGSAVIAGMNGYCCSETEKHCFLGSEGTTCPVKIVDGYSYSLSVCAKSELLLPVASAKAKLDQFFKNLDPDSEKGPNYFIVSIVPINGDGIRNMQQTRLDDDVKAHSLRIVAVDRGDRFIELGNLVQNGSLALDILSDDYSPVLDAIGKSIILNKSTFTLSRAPTNTEEMTIKIIHDDGTFKMIDASQFEIREKSIVFKDEKLVLSFRANDKVLINYQPKTVF